MLLSGVDPGQVVWVGEPPHSRPHPQACPSPNLNPNIYIQIFLTDLHTISLVIDLLILITFSLACVQTLPPPPFPQEKLEKGRGVGSIHRLPFVLIMYEY